MELLKAVITFLMMNCIGNAQETIDTDKFLRDAAEARAGARNTWLDWIAFIAESLKIQDSYMCTVPRPVLSTVPARGENTRCLVKIFSGTNVPGCADEEERHPATTLSSPTGVIVAKNNYTCVRRTSGTVDVKAFEEGWCEKTLTQQQFLEEELVHQKTGRADVWWLCGDMKIRSKLTDDWKGECALVSLAMPLKIVGAGRELLNLAHRYHIEAASDLVDYVYYNQQRFAHDSKVVNISHELLGDLSMMAVEDQIVVDLFLAEIQGKSKNISPLWCTYYPENMGPDGKFTKALQRLDKLSKGQFTGSDQQQWFGNWSWIVGGALVALMCIAALVRCVKGFARKLKQE